ncbi:MAG: ATP-binding protein [Bacteroidia bacterium]|nr:ATP-binding protein [Bacteroidia bacterium]
MNFRENNLEFGQVGSVDGKTIKIKAEKLEILQEPGNPRSMLIVEVGAFVNCGGSHGDTICIISRVLLEEVVLKNPETGNIELGDRKVVELSVVGSLKNQKFSRGVDRLPTINCKCYLLIGNQIQHILGVDLSEEEDGRPKKYFKVGKRPMLDSGDVYFDLDKFLGRHVAILGTTGSGKSCTVATIAQSILRDYPYPRMVFFDIHDEYAAAFPASGNKSNIIPWKDFSLPYWFLDFEEFMAIFYPGAGTTQVAFIKSEIERLKKEQFEDNQILFDRVSVDSPVFFLFEDLLEVINTNSETGTKTEKEPWIKIQMRFNLVRNDPRYSFLFREIDAKTNLEDYFKRLLSIATDDERFITILDLSGLPTEVRTACVGVLARLFFDFRFWDYDPENLPIALILEEAHSYIPDEGEAKYKIALERIERIAKEGRKYGISLVVVSQRPSNVSSTVLSQCGTFVTLRLTNDKDQNKIGRLLPDTLGDQTNILSGLRDGEALVSGDAIKLPGKVYFERPDPEPKSNDVKYHNSWTSGISEDYDLARIIYSWNKGEKTETTNEDQQNQD